MFNINNVTSSSVTNSSINTISAPINNILLINNTYTHQSNQQFINNSHNFDKRLVICTKYINI